MPKKKTATAGGQIPSHYGRAEAPEYNSGVPLEMPMGSCRPRPIQEIIASMVRAQVAQEKDIEPESWEDSNDFEIEDELDGMLNFSAYELKELQAPEGFVDYSAAEASESTETPQKGPTPPESDNGSEGPSGEDSGDASQAPR